jgi:hypothetical protein
MMIYGMKAEILLMGDQLSEAFPSLRTCTSEEILSFPQEYR